MRHTGLCSTRRCVRASHHCGAAWFQRFNVFRVAQLDLKGLLEQISAAVTVFDPRRRDIDGVYDVAAEAAAQKAVESADAALDAALRNLTDATESYTPVKPGENGSAEMKAYNTAAVGGARLGDGIIWGSAHGLGRFSEKPHSQAPRSCWPPHKLCPWCAERCREAAAPLQKVVDNATADRAAKLRETRAGRVARVVAAERALAKHGGDTADARAEFAVAADESRVSMFQFLCIDLAGLVRLGRAGAAGPPFRQPAAAEFGVRDRAREATLARLRHRGAELAHSALAVWGAMATEQRDVALDVVARAASRLCASGHRYTLLRADLHSAQCANPELCALCKLHPSHRAAAAVQGLRFGGHELRLPLCAGLGTCL
eukprot:SAG11_NODE_540_length_8654_cov_9.626110_8_plen_373_part_00